MAVLTPVKPDFIGTDPGFVAASALDQIAYDATRVLIVRNGSGSSINVTIELSQNVLFGVASADLVSAVGAGLFKVFRLSEKMVNPASGMIDITYSSLTTVTVAVIQLSMV